MVHINVPPFILFLCKFGFFEGRKKHIPPKEFQSVLSLFNRNTWLILFVVIFNFFCFFIKVLPHNLSWLLFLLASLSFNCCKFLFLHGRFFFDKIEDIFGFLLNHGCEVENSVLGDRFLFGVIFDWEHFTYYCFFKYLDWF